MKGRSAQFAARRPVTARPRGCLVARILVVDDDRQFRRAVRVVLTVHGHAVTEAANGSEALEQLKTAPQDLVLLDWQMPVTGGAETCVAMKAFSQTPVIVLSARDRSREARAFGLSGSLTKPVDTDTLLDCIDMALRGGEAT